MCADDCGIKDKEVPQEAAVERLAPSCLYI
jgi:hypothetical protein